MWSGYCLLELLVGGNNRLDPKRVCFEEERVDGGKK